MKGKCLVTGCAGFIGSHVVERLLSLDYEVIGIDSFTNYYPPRLKRLAINTVLRNECFKLIEDDLTAMDISPILSEVDYVIHEAAQPGVRTSWGSNFELYIRNNILATQRLLEACRASKVKKVIFASSSSVYGNMQSVPFKEDMRCIPFSPYGITKLACENLCFAYRENFGIPVIILRYFTVYGPGQRPDMAFYKFLLSALKGGKIIIFGGDQSRDFTYIDDIVDATVASMNLNVEGDILNIGSGRSIPLLDALKIIEDVTGRKLEMIFEPNQKGDVNQIYADITKARRLLGYSPKMDLHEGLEKEYEWVVSLLKKMNFETS
jgi:nucleoside-diphosphate-sugar epimerase